MEGCGETYVPDYGNEEPCNPISAECVVFEDAITLLNLTENSTAKEVLTNLLLYIQNQNVKIQVLENRVDQLEQQ